MKAETFARVCEGGQYLVTAACQVAMLLLVAHRLQIQWRAWLDRQLATFRHDMRMRQFEAYYRVWKVDHASE